MMLYVFFFKYTATTEIYTYRHTLSLHDALPGPGEADIEAGRVRRLGPVLHRPAEGRQWRVGCDGGGVRRCRSPRTQRGRRALPSLECSGGSGCNRRRLRRLRHRSEEHTSELQSLMRISYAVFCLKKK